MERCRIIGEWINFPIKQENLQKVLDKIGINENYEEWFFSDYDINLSGISDVLGEYANTDELNYLAGRLKEMDSYDYEKFFAMVEDEVDLPQTGLPGLINLTFNIFMKVFDLIFLVKETVDFFHSRCKIILKSLTLCSQTC